MTTAHRAVRCRDLHLDLMRLHERLLAGFAPALRGLGVSAPQYNVLRILRGAGERGLPGREIAERMVNRVPDVTRLVDRLEKAGWVRRERCLEDRRVVYVRIEPAGLKLLEEFDAPILARHEAMWSGLGDRELAALHDLVRRSMDILEANT